jgi:hypothetical protein
MPICFAIFFCFRFMILLSDNVFTLDIVTRAAPSARMRAAPGDVGRNICTRPATSLTLVAIFTSPWVQFRVTS